MAEKAQKTSTFVWEGTDRKGAKIKGETAGQNIALVKAQLRKQGINPTKVRKKAVSLFGAGKAIKPLDIALFTRQMATMMKAGVPLLQSFDIIGEGFENPNMRKLIDEVKQDVAAGNSFAASLRKRPRYFDELYCNLVDAGEQSGALENLLDRVATYKEKTEALKAKIKKAMNYPIAVIVVAIIVTAILLIKGSAAIRRCFRQLRRRTASLYPVGGWHLREYCRSGGIVYCWHIGCGFALPRSHRRSQDFRDKLDRAVLKAAHFWRHLYKSSSRSLCPHPGNHLCRRCTTGGCPGFSSRRHRQCRVQECRQQNQAGCLHRHATELLHAHHRAYSQPWPCK